MRKLIAATAFVALAIVPALSGAHSPNPNGSCNNVEAEEATTVANPVDNSQILHIVQAGPNVYQESNGVAGLQTHSHVCRTNTTGDTTVAADTKLL